MIRQAALLIMVLFLAHPLAAQKVFKLRIKAEEASVFWEKIKNQKFQVTDNQKDSAIFVLSLERPLDSLCQKLLKPFHRSSYLVASIDSLEMGPDSIAHGQFYLGPGMRWVGLKLANSDSERWVYAAGYRQKMFSGRPLYYADILRLQRRILVQAENNGYPFARVWLDSIAITPDGAVSAQLQVDRQRYFSFKGLKLHGDVQLPNYYLPNYLNLRPGMPYSRARVLRLRDQLQSLLFLESSSDPSIAFTGTEATVNLFLQKKRASRFDFILGLLPQPDNNNAKLLLTGSLSAAFQNALSLGEQFSIDLERLRPETQKLDVSAAVPYLFGSAFGVDGHLGIFKRDSTWVDAQTDVGVQYLFRGSDYLRVLWANKSASLQKIDTALIKSTRNLPENLDFKQNSFGLESAFTRLDYRYNPRKGWTLFMKATAGFNQILRNNQIESLRDTGDLNYRYSSLYDSITQRATRFNLELRGAFYIPIFTRATIKIGLRAGGIFSNKSVYANEQFRLGGNKLLRGFNEESLQATRFVLATAEWRLLIGQNSFLSTFADWAYLENFTNRNHFYLRPLGLGAGLNFETSAGIFGISVAVGRGDPGQAFSFRAAKFHLGYVSLF